MTTQPPDLIEDPKESLLACIACDVRDWAADKRSAWVFGIVVGWEDEPMRELAERFAWSPSEVSRLQRLHAAFVRLSAESSGSVERKPLHPYAESACILYQKCCDGSMSEADMLAGVAKLGRMHRLESARAKVPPQP